MFSSNHNQSLKNWSGKTAKIPAQDSPRNSVNKPNFLHRKHFSGIEQRRTISCYWLTQISCSWELLSAAVLLQIKPKSVTALDKGPALSHTALTLLLKKKNNTPDTFIQNSDVLMYVEHRNNAWILIQSM